MLAKFFPKNPKPSRKRKIVMSPRTTIAISALLPKKALMKSSARQRRTDSGAASGGAATTSAILQSCRLGNGGGKCRSVTFMLQNSCGGERPGRHSARGTNDRFKDRKSVV